MTLQGQIALVTGASRGIGQAIAQELGRQGATVRVPVPTGREAEARALVEWFTTGHWPGA